MEGIVILEVLITWALSFYNFRFLHGVGLYRSIMCWQFTIMSLHIAPVVSLKQLGLASTAEFLVFAALVSASWTARNFNMSIFSVVMLQLEIGAYLCDDVPWLPAIALLQLVIASVAWAGMILASCFEDFSFVPMDRHLHKGWRHFRRSAAARRCFVHEFSSHCVAQLVFADLLRRRLPAAQMDGHGGHGAWAAAIYGALVIQAFYASMVLTAAMLISPHALPYNLGTVPKPLRFPVTLPPSLYGDGASDRIAPERFPWWAQVPKDESESRNKND